MVLFFNKYWTPLNSSFFYFKDIPGTAKKSSAKVGYRLFLRDIYFPIPVNFVLEMGKKRFSEYDTSYMRCLSELKNLQHFALNTYRTFLNAWTLEPLAG